MERGASFTSCTLRRECSGGASLMNATEEVFMESKWTSLLPWWDLGALVLSWAEGR